MFKGGGGGGGGVVWRGQEPVGYTQLTNRDYNITTEDSWNLAAAGGSTANFTIASDPTAPRSPNNVGRINFPGPFADGTEPVNVWHGASGNKLYVCKYFKLSANWWGHTGSNTNKIVHYKMDTTGTSNRIFSVAYGSGNGGLAPGFGLQGIASNFDFNAQGGGFANTTTGWLFPNQPGHTNDVIPRGTWQQWEHLIQLGSAGSANGRIQWWIDGVLIGDYINIPLITATAAFTEIDWAPTWGGFDSETTQNGDQQMFQDALYMSTHA